MSYDATQRQEAQIVQSCMTLDDSLPRFGPQAIRLGSQGGAGPSLSVSPRWGDLATGGGDALWQEQVYSRYAPAAPSADGAPTARDPWAVDVRGNYGMRIPGNRLLTWSATVNHSPLGPRFTAALQLGFAGSPKAARPATATQPLP